MRSGVGQNIRIFDTEIPCILSERLSAVGRAEHFTHDANVKVANAYRALTKEAAKLGRDPNRSGDDRIR